MYSPTNLQGNFDMKMTGATALVCLQEIHRGPRKSSHLRDLSSFCVHTPPLPAAQGLPEAHCSHLSERSVSSESNCCLLSLQGVSSPHKDSFSQQAEMTWKFDSTRVADYSFSREEYYLTEASFYPAVKLRCVLWIVSD